MPRISVPCFPCFSPAWWYNSYSKFVSKVEYTPAENSLLSVHSIYIIKCRGINGKLYQMTNDQWIIYIIFFSGSFIVKRKLQVRHYLTIYGIYWQATNARLVWLISSCINNLGILICSWHTHVGVRQRKIIYTSKPSMLKTTYRTSKIYCNTRRIKSHNIMNHITQALGLGDTHKQIHHKCLVFFSYWP